VILELQEKVKKSHLMLKEQVGPGLTETALNPSNECDSEDAIMMTEPDKEIAEEVVNSDVAMKELDSGMYN